MNGKYIGSRWLVSGSCSNLPIVEGLMMGKTADTAEFTEWHGVSRRQIWHLMNKGMPHIKDDKPGTPIIINTSEAEK